MSRKFKKFILAASITTVTVFSTLLIIPNESEKYTSVEAYVVSNGDTLWSIAKEYQPQGDIRKFIYEISEFNNIKAHELREGQEIFIPRR